MEMIRSASGLWIPTDPPEPEPIPEQGPLPDMLRECEHCGSKDVGYNDRVTTYRVYCFDCKKRGPERHKPGRSRYLPNSINHFRDECEIGESVKRYEELNQDVHHSGYDPIA